MGTGGGSSLADWLRGAGRGTRVLLAVGERLPADAPDRGADYARRGRAADQRVTLGTSALLPVLRRPVQAAQALASIDRLSGGRLVLTVGAAFPGRFGVPQHALSEVPWERRFTRLDETVALWRQLWASPYGGGSFHGSLLRFGDLPPIIAPSRAGGPPVWLGGASESALRRTGRMYDGWMPYPPAAAQYAEGLAAVRTAAAEAGAARTR